LFFIFVNGFTYGRLYLQQVLSIAGFLSVVALVPWWGRAMQTSVGWIVAIYLCVLIRVERLKAARFKAEQALRERLGRNRSEVD